MSCQPHVLLSYSQFPTRLCSQLMAGTGSRTLAENIRSQELRPNPESRNWFSEPCRNRLALFGMKKQVLRTPNHARTQDLVAGTRNLPGISSWKHMQNSRTCLGTGESGTGSGHHPTEPRTKAKWWFPELIPRTFLELFRISDAVDFHLRNTFGTYQRPPELCNTSEPPEPPGIWLNKSF